MFKKNYLYFRIYRDKLTLTNLETGETVSTSPGTRFSSPRSVLGDMSQLLELGKPLVKQLVRPGFFSLRMLIQQMEDIEGGPSQIEERALRDIAYMAGGRIVVTRTGSKELSNEEARKLL